MKPYTNYTLEIKGKSKILSIQRLDKEYKRKKNTKTHERDNTMLRAWSPGTAFHGVCDAAGPARPDYYRSAQLRRQWTTNMVCQPILERQIRLCAPSSVISRQTCFSSCSLRCCWQVGSAPFVRRRCDCSASSAPFTNIQTYLLTYNKSSNKILERWFCQEMKKLTTGTRLDTISQPDRQTDRRTDGRTFRRIYRGTRFSYGVAYFSHVTDVFFQPRTFHVPAFFVAIACQYLSTYVGAPERIPGEMIFSKVFRCAT